MSLIPGYRALAPIARVMHWANVVKGYTPGSWREVDREKYHDALARHVTQWLDDPQGKDPESELPILAHVGACVLILLWHENP
jgi:hypothetical protein